MDIAALMARAEACERAGAPRDAEAAYDILIVAATRGGDQVTLAEAFRRQAVLAHQAGDSMRARSALQHSYAVTTLLGDGRLTAKTLNTLGGIELETRNLDAAETALAEAASLASEDPALLARISQNLGIVANIRGDHAAAAVNYRRSLAAYEALSDPQGSAIAHHNLGMLAADRGALAEASEHFQACESLARLSGDTHLVALCRVNYAEVLLLLGRRREARSAAEEAQRTFESIEANFDAPDVQRVLALCDRAEGLLRQAETRLLRARELARIADARLIEAEVARDLGRVYAESGRPVQARAALKDAVRTFSELGAAGDMVATEHELELLALAP
ncbi:MAG TPA: tetratricopeptide repeat protein [Gemmatimonadales bacterium]|jgi:tetratricopeptide (TPR) repeat protein